MARQPGPEVDHSAPSRATIKAEWSHTSTPHTWLHGVERYRLTFTFKVFMLMLQPMKVTYADPILHALHEEHQSIDQSIGMNRMWWFLAVLSRNLHSSLSYTFSCHSSPPTILPSSLTSSCHLFLGLPLGLIVSKFKYNTLLGILFSSILCTYLKKRNKCIGGIMANKIGCIFLYNRNLHWNTSIYDLCVNTLSMMWYGH